MCEVNPLTIKREIRSILKKESAFFDVKNMNQNILSEKIYL